MIRFYLKNTRCARLRHELDEAIGGDTTQFKRALDALNQSDVIYVDNPDIVSIFHIIGVPVRVLIEICERHNTPQHGDLPPAAVREIFDLVTVRRASPAYMLERAQEVRWQSRFDSFADFQKSLNDRIFDLCDFFATAVNENLSVEVFIQERDRGIAVNTDPDIKVKGFTALPPRIGPSITHTMRGRRRTDGTEGLDEVISTADLVNKALKEAS